MGRRAERIGEPGADAFDAVSLCEKVAKPAELGAVGEAVEEEGEVDGGEDVPEGEERLEEGEGVGGHGELGWE